MGVFADHLVHGPNGEQRQAGIGLGQRAPHLRRQAQRLPGRVQHQEGARVAGIRFVSLRDRLVREAPLADIVHHPDHLLPGTVVAALRKHLPERTLFGPEGQRHGFVNHDRRNNSVGFGVGRAAALRQFLEARVDCLHTIDIGGIERASLE